MQSICECRVQHESRQTCDSLASLAQVFRAEYASLSFCCEVSAHSEPACQTLSSPILSVFFHISQAPISYLRQRRPVTDSSTPQPIMQPSNLAQLGSDMSVSIFYLGTLWWTSRASGLVSIQAWRVFPLEFHGHDLCCVLSNEFVS